MNAVPAGRPLGSAQYEIRLQGHLDPRWAAWFDGLTLINENDGTTALRGTLVDQAALHGALQKVRDTGLPLISVTNLDEQQPHLHPPAQLTHEGGDMTTTVPPTAATRPSPDSMRRTSLAVGILYLLTFASVPTLMVFQPVRDGADLVLGAGSDTGVLWGSFSEVVVALAGIGTAVVMFPVAKRVSETAALGFVTARVVEGALIIVGVVSMLSLVSLRNDVAGTDSVDSAAALVIASQSHIASYDWTFLLSQSLMPVFSALCLGTVLYRSGLVPRILPTLGLIGAPLLLTSDIAIFFGVIDRISPFAVVAFIPIAVWEFSLGVYLTVKGFRPSAVAALLPVQAVR